MGSETPGCLPQPMNWQDQIKEKQPHGCLAIFYAQWHPPSLNLIKVAEGIQTQYQHIKVLTVDVDQNKDFVKSVGGVDTVPTTFFLQPNGELVDKVVGANPPQILSLVQKHHENKYALAEESAATAKKSLDERLKELINCAPVMVFMKGAKHNPFCKFSKVAVAILNSYEDVEWASFDIFEDQEVREGLKKYSDWPTYPQIYINGELMGGVDILKEMHEEGSLKDTLPKATQKQGQEEALKQRLESLINREKLMLFMKGSPDQPQCKFAVQVVGILKEAGITYGHFNILEDSEVREGLKKYSDWPTYPQLYANGQLIGGVDVIRELHESGELMQEIEAAM